MTENDRYENSPSQSAGFSNGIGQKLTFFLIGGGIGAMIALLFAPKPGRELRSDIADAAGKRYNETLEAANHIKDRSSEYYQSAKAKGGEVLHVLAEGVAAVKEEVSTDAEKIGAIVEDTTKRVINSAKAANMG